MDEFSVRGTGSEAEKFGSVEFLENHLPDRVRVRTQFETMRRGRW
jgi:hypothetical protein